jgi:hypothetical protein
MYKYVGARKAFVISFSLVALGALFLILVNQFYDTQKED